MSKNALNSVPGGRRVAHVVLASMLLAAAGASHAVAGGRGPDDDRNKGSGMTRMQQMGRPQQQAAPAPRREAPAPQRSAPSAAPRQPAPQPMVMPRHAPMIQPSAPRMSSPGGPGAPIMRMRAPDDVPQGRTYSQPSEDRRQTVVPPSPPRVVPRQAPPSPAPQGNAPINRMRAPQDRAPSPAPQQVSPPREQAPASPPRSTPAPQQVMPRGSSPIPLAERDSGRGAPMGNAPITRLRAPDRDPQTVSASRDAGPASPATPGINFTRGGGRGSVANITTDTRAPGAPIMRLRAPALHEAALPAPVAPTVPGVSHLANPRLGVDARVADASRRWRDHDRRDGFRGGRDDFGHGRFHDHFDRHRHHSSFVTSVYFYEPWTWGGSYVSAPTLPSTFCRWNSGWSWGVGYWASNVSIGFTFGDPWCSYPAYHHRYRSYFTGCYNPIAYSLEYPTYAYTYPVYPVDYGTTINNYYTSPLYAASSAQEATPDYRAYSSTAQGQIYTNDGYLPNPAMAGARPDVPVGDDAATVYRSSRDHGPMAWSDTATSIINALVSAPADQRHAVVRQYLGRSPAGAWEVTYEGRQDFDGATELTCRGTATTTTGGRPTIVVRVNRTVGAMTPGQRLSVTGRLSEVSVDDSSNPGGLLVLENADVSW